MTLSKLQTDFDVSFLSAFKTPARAKYFYDITERGDIDELYDIISFARTEKIPFMIVAGGTNCLFAFDHYEGIIIRNRYAGWEHPFHVGDHLRVRVHSGESVNFVSTKLYEHNGVSTLIPWIGLPGSFGGATVGNAGCFGLEMADIFVEAEVLDLQTGEVRIMKPGDMQFAYRESMLKHTQRYFVLSTLIDLAPRGIEYETYTPEKLRGARREKQPPGFSCGSFFKNPTSPQPCFASSSEGVVQEHSCLHLSPKGEGAKPISAGKLIDDAGLKGTRIGGVKVSEQHGNFLINDQKAKWQDIIELRNLIKNTILGKYGIELEEEVRIIK